MMLSGREASEMAIGEQMGWVLFNKYLWKKKRNPQIQGIAFETGET